MDLEKYIIIIIEENFKNSKKEVKGILINDKGDKLEFNFKNNIIEGNGILNYNDGRIINDIFDKIYFLIERKLILKMEKYMKVN